MPTPDFTIKQNFPIADVINASLQAGKLRQQQQEDSLNAFAQGMKAIGDTATNLASQRLKVAQSLALGKLAGVPDDQAKLMEPEQLVSIYKAQHGDVDLPMLMAGLQFAVTGKPNTLVNGAASHSGTPNLDGTPATPAATPIPGAAPAKAGNVQASVPIPPDRAPVMLAGGLPPSTTDQAAEAPAPVPIQPPGMPKKVNKETARFMTQVVMANKPENVVDEKSGEVLYQVPKGTHFVDPNKTSPGDYVTHIGNTHDGKPILMDRSGNMRIGKVPAEGENPAGGPVLPKSSTMPTSQARSSAEFAQSMLPHIDEFRQLINLADKKGLIGPASGRIWGDLMAGKVGTTGDPQMDRLVGQLRAFDSLIKSGVMKVHFGTRGGTQMFEHFSDMLNSGKQSAAMMNGALDGMATFLHGYASVGNSGNDQTAAPASQADGIGLSGPDAQRLMELRAKKAKGTIGT